MTKDAKQDVGALPKKVVSHLVRAAEPGGDDAPEYGSEPAQLKAFVEYQLARVVNWIAEQGREPDEWESEHIQAAMDALASGENELANYHLHLILVLPQGREPR